MEMASLSLSLFLLLLFAIGCSCVPLAWEDLGVTGTIRGRWFAGTAFADGNLFVFGGQGNSRSNDSGILGDTWRIDVSSSSNSWVQISTTVSPDPRYGFVGGVIGNYWIISHGCDFDTCFSDTWALDLTAVNPEWFQLLDTSNTSDPYPDARFTVAGGVYPGSSQLWLSMGEELAGRKLSDTWILQINDTEEELTGRWSVVSIGGGLNQYNPLLPHGRSLHTGGPITNVSFAIFGGCASGGKVGGPCPLQDNWILDLELEEWSSFSTCATPVVRANIVMVPTQPGQAFILMGSHNYSPGVFPQLIVPLNESSVDGEIYIMNTGQVVGNFTEWKRIMVTEMFPVNREGASTAVDMAGGVVYLFGGREVESSDYRSDVWRLSGDGETDLDQGCPPPYLSYVHLHGIFMYVAWGLFLPLGALLGRYYRWAWPCWFILHILLQSLGVLLTVAGFVTVFMVGSFSNPDFPHAIVGIVLTFILIQQFLSGIFHPCVDKENGKTPRKEKTSYRKCWEVYHAASGFIAVAIGLGQVMLGMLLVNAPMVVWCVWAGLGCLWVLTFIIHEVVFICYKIVHRIRRKRVY